MSTLFFKLLF